MLSYIARFLTSNAQDPAKHRFPDWPPDGHWIAYLSETASATGLYLVPARGGLPLKVANLPGSSDIRPAWAR